MKAMYLSPVGKKVDLADRSTVEGHTVVDMDPVRRAIVAELRHRFPGLDLVDVADAYAEPSAITAAELRKYSFMVCDLTTGNGNVLYLAGLAEGVQLPIVYILNSESPYPNALNRRRFLNYSSHGLSDEFFAGLFALVETAIQDPARLSSDESRPRPSSAFLSYSHRDRAYLDRLLVHLRPIEKRGVLDVWVDTRIKAGDRWRESIQSALERASIAILLVSADFLASDFIVDNELPPLLSNAEVNGTRIIPVVLSPCRYARDSALNRFQSANDPSQPLSSMSHDERELIYDRLVLEIERAIPPAPADATV